MSTNSITLQSRVPAFIHSYWLRLAYRHKWAEFFLYFMFVSGLMLWERIEISWQMERWTLLIHMLIGISIFSLVVGAFWSSHRRLFLTSKKPFLRKTGTLLEWLLSICSLSGFYLFFYGNTGNQVSLIIQDVHFYSSFALVPLVFRHALRWSIINFKK